jgi:tetratricopeptide (TPR) repeat protein
MFSRLCVLLLLSFSLLSSGLAYGASLGAITDALDHAQSAEEILRQERLLESMAAEQAPCPRIDVLTQLGRAYYLLGESETDKKKAMAYLNKAVSTLDRVLRAEPNGTHSIYWRCMALLKQSDIDGGLKALGKVKEAMKGLEVVSSRDEMYDSAGAYRTRGKVLIDAPSWSFIGDKKKGMELLEKAKNLVPSCLLNHLYLAQAYLANGRKEDAKAQLGFVMATPVNPQNQKDDMETKAEAKKLFDSL